VPQPGSGSPYRDSHTGRCSDAAPFCGRPTNGDGLYVSPPLPALAGFRSAAKEFRLSIGEHPAVDFVLELGRVLAKPCPNIVATRDGPGGESLKLSGCIASVSEPCPSGRDTCATRSGGGEGELVGRTPGSAADPLVGSLLLRDSAVPGRYFACPSTFYVAHSCDK